MSKKNTFEEFAPSVLKVYHRDKEAFWAAVMAPFLADNTSLLAWLGHLKVDFGLLSAFKGLDDEARQALKNFSAPLGLDVTTWKSNRLQYFKDAYPVFAFLAVWMDEEGLTDLLQNFGDILRAGVFTAAGYRILDENVDSDTSSPAEILTAQALIAEYETLALQIFGVSKVNLDILHKMRALFLNAEIQKKSTRHKASPYELDNPKQLGAKGANAVTPFLLSLERLGKASLVDEYWEVFLLFGAAIRMIDDWNDLEKDLAAGHYSYVTLGFEKLNEPRDPKKIAQLLRDDKQCIRDTYTTSNRSWLRKEREYVNHRPQDPYKISGTKYKCDEGSSSARHSSSGYISAIRRNLFYFSRSPELARRVDLSWHLCRHGRNQYEHPAAK